MIVIIWYQTMLFISRTKRSSWESRGRACVIFIGIDEPLFEHHDKNLSAVVKLAQDHVEALNDIFIDQVSSSFLLLCVSICKMLATVGHFLNEAFTLSNCDFTSHFWGSRALTRLPLQASCDSVKRIPCLCSSHLPHLQIIGLLPRCLWFRYTVDKYYNPY